MAPQVNHPLRSVYLYPGDRDSAEFHRLVEHQHDLAGVKLPAAARRALVRFSSNFYGLVYPPNAPVNHTFDFGDAKFLQDYVRESRNLFRTKGVMTEFIFMARAEIGLYQTLHRLKARVSTSQIVRKYL